MNAVRANFYRLLRDQRGATAIEYGLIASLIIVAMMGGMTALGGGSNGMWGRMSAQVVAAL